MSIPSSPATFSVDDVTPISQVCTFAIPAGTYSSGTWDAVANENVGALGVGNLDIAYVSNISLFPAAGVGSHPGWSQSAAVTAGQLSNINANAGGTISVTVSAGTNSNAAVTSFTLTLVGTAAGNPPNPPDIIDSWQPKRFDWVYRKLLNPFFTAIPVTPIDTNVSSVPVRIAFHQDMPGVVLIENFVSSSPVRMVFAGGGGSEANGANLFTSSRPVRMAFTSAAGTATTVLQTGNLKFSMCRDNRGATWTTEHTIATGVDANSCGVAWLGNRWGCLYTVGGQAYWKTATDPDDWSAGPSTVTSITGRVYGLARNQVGILCALVDKKPVVSRNGGLTWTASAALTMDVPASICAKNHYFVIVSPKGTAARHFVSKDGGDTFV